MSNMQDDKGADATEETGKKQKPWLFKPGQSGNLKGRPKGARNKLTEAFLADMYSAWQEKGRDAIDRVIAERPQDFIKAVAQIVPKEVHVRETAVEELSDDELAAALATLRSVLAASHAGTGAGTETLN